MERGCWLPLIFGLLTLSSAKSEVSLFPSLPVSVYKSDNTVCREQSDIYRDHLKNYTLWAQEMWDATAKSYTGVLRGSIFQMGDFEQCLTARAPFKTQYCLATITAHVPKPEKSRDELSLYYDPHDSVLTRLYKYKDKSQQSRNVINMGWCIPASCSTLDLKKYLNEYLININFTLKSKNVTYDADFNEEFCQTSNEMEYFDGADISFCLLTILLIAMVIIATSYDFTTSEEEEIKEKPIKKSLLRRLILTFSARQNFNELSVINESDPALTVLYGVRTFSILIIILDHRFGTFVSSALLNFDYVETQYRSPLACLLFHGDLFVDTFFILSGLLVFYGLMNQFEKNKMNVGFLIILRYVRLTPVYAYVIFYYATVFNYTGNGPLWKVIAGGDFKDCRKNWWTNLLYISNYVNADHMCMTHSWYLPCDFHYFIIAIGLCLLIKKEKKVGLSALLSFTVVSIIIPFILTVVYQRPALLHFYPDFLTGPKVHPDFLLTYSKSHTRATPYFFGMLVGYLYYKNKGTNAHICRVRSLLVASASLCLLAAAVFGGAVFYEPRHPHSAAEAGAYAAMHRPAWALGSLGLLYVASYGHAAALRAALRWRPWVPLSKLVYGAYLVHMQFQLRSAARFKSARQITYFDVISLALSDMVLAFAVALCLYLMIEAPFRRIFREIFMPPKKPSKQKDEPTQNENANNNKYQDSRL